MPASPSETRPQAHGSRFGATSWLWLIPLLGLGGALHWPGGADFKCDDYGIIRYVLDFKRVLHDFVGPQYDLEFFRFWRPFITLSFWIDYQLFGTAPFGYFAMNTLALLVAAGLLFALLRSLWPGRGKTAFAAIVVLLWMCHPATGTALRCWAAGRVDTHYVPPLLLALLLHVRHRRGGPQWPVWVAVTIAVGSKESALGFPLLALAIDCLDPTPSTRNAPRLFGRAFPGVWYLLLFPLSFLLRFVFLGAMIGGYDSAQDIPTAALTAPGAVWHLLGRIFFPETPLEIRWFGGVIVLCLVSFWLWRGAGKPLRAAAAGLIAIAILAPIVQLFEPVESQDVRLAYFPSIVVLALWVGICLGVSRRFAPLRVIVAMAPLAWLLPAALVERARMDGHDAFITSLKTALRQCDALLPGHEPVVVAGDASFARHPYRFGWALGSVLKPPFQTRWRDVVTLWPQTPRAPRPPSNTVTAGLPAWVEVSETGGRLVTATATALATRRDYVEPVGFPGILTLELIRDPGMRLRAGYPVESDYTGQVIVCTGVGSISIHVPARGGLVPLQGILAPIADQFWLPMDLDKDCPFFLVFAHRSGVSIGRLSGGTGFARQYVRWRRRE